MAQRPLKRPRDTVQLAKLIGDIATGQVEDKVEETKDPKAIARGKAGGPKGGTVRMGNLSPEERKKLALKAAQARWSKKKA